MLEDKVILVTGGTGSFGETFIRMLLQEYEFREVRIFSPDEKKQQDMRLSFNDPRLNFFVGSIRDHESVFSAMKSVDLVFHVAALKQVPSCEFFPMEAVKANIVGTGNILDAAEYHEVKNVVVLSTDKAVFPSTPWGSPNRS